MTKNTKQTHQKFYSWLAKSTLFLAIFIQMPLGYAEQPITSVKSTATDASVQVPTPQNTEAPSSSGTTISTPPLASANTPSILPSIFALLFVIALLLGLTWFLKRIGVGATGKNGSFLKTLAVSNLGTREKIALVEIGETWLVLGITPSSIRTLHTLPKGSFELPGSIDTAQAFAKLLERVKRPEKS
jgi:flagellar protein FliO/FliZ